MIEIIKWRDVFETADSRKRQVLKWIYWPTKCDSNGMITLLSKGAEGLMALGVFTALCQQSATFDKELRGRFVHADGRQMKLEFIATLIRVDPCHLRAALEVLAAQDVKWIKVINKTRHHAESLPPPCQSHDSFVIGREGKGMERKGEERAGARETLSLEDGVGKYLTAIGAPFRPGGLSSACMHLAADRAVIFTNPDEVADLVARIPAWLAERKASEKISRQKNGRGFAPITPRLALESIDGVLASPLPKAPRKETEKPEIDYEAIEQAKIDAQNEKARRRDNENQG